MPATPETSNANVARVLREAAVDLPVHTISAQVGKPTVERWPAREALALADALDQQAAVSGPDFHGALTNTVSGARWEPLTWPDRVELAAAVMYEQTANGGDGSFDDARMDDCRDDCAAICRAAFPEYAPND